MTPTMTDLMFILAVLGALIFASRPEPNPQSNHGVARALIDLRANRPFVVGFRLDGKSTWRRSTELPSRIESLTTHLRAKRHQFATERVASADSVAIFEFSEDESAPPLTVQLVYAGADPSASGPPVCAFEVGSTLKTSLNNLLEGKGIPCN